MIPIIPSGRRRPPSDVQDHLPGRGARATRTASTSGPILVEVQAASADVEVEVDPGAARATITVGGAQGRRLAERAQWVDEASRFGVTLIDEQQTTTVSSSRDRVNLVGASIQNSTLSTGAAQVWLNGVHVGGHSGAAAVTIRVIVPPQTRLSARTVSGDIIAGAGLAQVQAHTSSGDVEVAQVAAAGISTTSGDIHLDGISAEVSAYSTSGDVTIKDHRGWSLSASTTSGDIRITCQAPEGRLTATSVSGDVRVRGRIPRNAHITSTSGRARQR